VFLRSLPICWLVLAALGAYQAAESPNAGKSRKSEGDRLLSQKMGKRWTVEVHRRPVTRSGSLPVSLIWLEAEEEGSRRRRPVWKELVRVRALKEYCAHDFTLGAKDEKEIALAYVEGSWIRFWEVSLETTVDVTEEAAAKLAMQTAFPVLVVENWPTNIPVAHMLREARIEYRAPKLQDVVWHDGRWRVRVSIGDREVIFERAPSSRQWKLIVR